MLLFVVLCLTTIQTVASQCTPPFEAVDVGCYVFSDGLFVDSYDDANNYCQSIGGYLAMIKRGEENRAIIDNYLENTKAELVLLGAKKDELSPLRWLDGSLVSDGFTAWGDDQPDGSGDCMGFNPLFFNLYWDDFTCSNYSNLDLSVGFLCEEQLSEITNKPSTTSTTDIMTTPRAECIDPFVNLGGIGCYLYVITQLPYSEARQSCEDLNSHLAFITSAEEQAVLEPYLEDVASGAYIFLGGYDIYGNDTMYWLDGTLIDSGYTNYYELSGGNHDALYMDDTFDWQWGDYPPTSTQPFLCERDL